MAKKKFDSLNFECWVDIPRPLRQFECPSPIIQVLNHKAVCAEWKLQFEVDLLVALYV